MLRQATARVGAACVAHARSALIHQARAAVRRAATVPPTSTYVAAIAYGSVFSLTRKHYTTTQTASGNTSPIAEFETSHEGTKPSEEEIRKRRREKAEKAAALFTASTKDAPILQLEPKQRELLNTLETILSDVNLPFDQKLKALTNGYFYEWFNVADLANLPALKELGATAELIMQVAEVSHHLEVDKTHDRHDRIRRLSPILDIAEQNAQLINWESYFRNVATLEDLSHGLHVYFLAHSTRYKDIGCAIRRCGQLGDVDMATRVLQAIEIIQPSFPMTLYADLSAAYALSGNIKASLVVLEFIRSNGVTISRNQWARCLTAVAQNGTYEDARAVLESMKAAGERPDEATYQLLMLSVGAYDPQAVKDIISEMEREGIAASTISFNYLIKVAKQNDNVEEARKIMEEMRSRGLTPSRDTYLLYLESLARAGDVEGCRQTMAIMEKDKVYRDDAAYRWFLTACHKGRDFQAAWDAAREMKARGIRWTRVTYHILLDLCRWSTDQKLSEIYDMMKNDSNITINSVTCNIMMSAVARMGDIQQAESIRALMQEKGFKQDMYTHNALVYTYGMANGPSAAMEKVLEFMQTEKAFKPTIVTHNILLTLDAKHNGPQKAYERLNEMQSQGVAPDVISYNCLIDAANKSGNIELMMSLYAELKQKGFKPNAVTFTSLTNALSRANAMDQLQTVLQEMADQGLQHSLVIKPLMEFKKANLVKRAQARDQADEEIDKVLFADAVNPNVTAQPSVEDEFLKSL
eukprot:comp21835_c0_seq1/m.31154 comp21835_c0_seq1/g.31154  ORF comp21835_c0_seq1/g.31154 comp21835_c0_seq1/m.31154 type:complete len:754 (-) comp21835_c0_seq1:429-2690(-)